jgi:hypothetical protein
MTIQIQIPSGPFNEYVDLFNKSSNAMKYCSHAALNNKNTGMFDEYLVNARAAALALNGNEEKLRHGVW